MRLIVIQKVYLQYNFVQKLIENISFLFLANRVDKEIRNLLIIDALIED